LTARRPTPTPSESEAGRRGLFAIFFFVVAVPSLLMGVLTVAFLVRRLLVHGPDTSTMAFYTSLGGCVLFIGPSAFGACIASLLAARRPEERLVRIFWAVLVLTAGTLSITALLG
jgi:hypothetical protein